MPRGRRGVAPRAAQDGRTGTEGDTGLDAGGRPSSPLARWCEACVFTAACARPAMGRLRLRALSPAVPAAGRAAALGRSAMGAGGPARSRKVQRASSRLGSRLPVHAGFSLVGGRQPTSVEGGGSLPRRVPRSKAWTSNN